jgi:hypothetical protein
LYYTVKLYKHGLLIQVPYYRDWEERSEKIRESASEAISLLNIIGKTKAGGYMYGLQTGQLAKSCSRRTNSNSCHSRDSIPHCNEIWIYVFPEKELRSLSPNFHFHMSVSDLFIPTFGPPIFLQQNRQTDGSEQYINHSQKQECRNWD